MSNLDDFFKKRDKKKKTTKSKFPTLDPEEFVKKLEATSIVNTGGPGLEGEDQELQEPVELSAATHHQPLANQSNANDHLDEDWKPFDSDENKDYSGLRINIQNWKSEDNDAINDGNLDENEKKTNCPWASQVKKDENSEIELNKLQQNLENTTNENENKPSLKTDQSSKTESLTATTTAATTTTTTTVSPTSSSATAATPTAYVPPALRRQQQGNDSADKQSSENTNTTTSSSSTGKYVPPSMRNKTSNDSTSAIPTTSVNYRRPNKAQPNIMDTSEFPTLDASGDTPADKVNGNNERFEMPKKSGKIEPKSGSSMIDLENKFTALSSTNN